MSSNTHININNIVAKSHIVPPFSLANLSAAFPFSTQSFLSRIYLPFRNINFSIFHSGSVISRASVSISELDTSFEWLRSIMASFDLKLSMDYEILNIVSSANLAPALNLLALAPHLPNCSYDPSPILNETEHECNVDAIVFYFDPKRKPRGTALIFSSGKIIFTGFYSFPDLESNALQFSSLLLQIIQKHPEVMND